MTNPCTFDDLLGTLHQPLAHLPDHRKGKNVPDSMHDAAVGAFGIFFPQSPSFLDDQRTLHNTHGDNNAQTLWGVHHIPWDHQVRTLLDPLVPSPLDGVLLTVLAGLVAHGARRPWRVLTDHLLVALDGPPSFSSQTMHGPPCLTRHTPQGHTLSDPAAIPPVVVCPRRPQGMAFPPEYIMPQDGHEQQDGARAAGQRWLTTHAPQGAPYGVTVRGDALYRHQPLCALALQQGDNFLLVCTPDSHPTFYARVAFWQAHDGLTQLESRHRNGRSPAVTVYRSLNDSPRRDGDTAVVVQGVDSTVVHGIPGEQLSHHSFLTPHPVTAERVAAVARAGRARWQIAKDNKNVLKTTGDQVAHHCGPGKQDLAAFLRSLNLLACLFHTVVEWCDDRDAVLRRVLARRQTFFEDIRAFTRYRVFDSWQHWMECMIRGLQLESPPDTG